MTTRPEDRCALYGTPEPVPETTYLSAGPLTAMLVSGALRRISWHGVEVVRGLECLVRDEVWRTAAQEAAEEKLALEGETFRYERRFAVMSGAITGNVEVSARSNGSLTARVELHAARRVTINRAGFVVLHPCRSLAGTNVTVEHPDGAISKTTLPLLVSPRQPAQDIRTLAYGTNGVNVRIRFQDDVFEMEDQRNWSDASFKTYSRPLAMPHPYTVAAGETIEQSVELTCEGAPPVSVSTVARAPCRITGAKHRLPDVALAVQDGWLPDAAIMPLIAASGVRRIQVRVSAADITNVLAGVMPLLEAIHAAVDAEFLLTDEPEAVRDEVARIAKVCAAAGLAPEHVMALPHAYMMSHQPDGPWPPGLTPAQAGEALGAAFADARVGGGMLTNFTEFNRSPPNAAECDFVTHGTTAIVHAADDVSVIETLEALPSIFASGAALGGGCSYRLGLSAIGMRTNPYGGAVAANEKQVRRAMAQADPRQRGLFAAAFAVGVVAAAHTCRIESIALAAPVGPFGIVHRPEAWPQPLFDTDPSLLVFPLYHVVRALAGLAELTPLALSGLPPDVRGIGYVSSGEARLVIANASETATLVILPDAMEFRTLDLESFFAAARDPLWLENAPSSHGVAVALGPYAVAFVRGTDTAA